MILKSLRAFLSSDLAIDLGTFKTVVLVKGCGIVYAEPSLVVVERRWGKRNPHVMACGKEATEILKKDEQHIQRVVVNPIAEGLITNERLTEEMLRYALRKVNIRRYWGRSRCIIGIPAGATQVQRRAATRIFARLPISKVHPVEKGFLSAVGSCSFADPSRAHMVVDIGCGTTEIAVITSSDIIYEKGS